ncbi:MAG: sugar-binding domain-containing protein, partial [Planctomycetota bacterium]
MLLPLSLPQPSLAQTDQASAKEAEDAGEAVPESGLNADSDRMDNVNNPGSVGSGDAANFNAVAAAGEMSGVLPTVRLTPRDVRMPGLWRGRLNLEGQWDFSHDVPENFDGNHESVAEWKQVQIPGHFARQGFERMKKEKGAKVVWHRGFDAPDNWQGNVVRLRFESLDGLANVWVNGNHVGSRDVATLPSEYDITPHVKYGERNHITITVEWSLATHWSRRELGSIGRQVWLQALPPVNVARLHVAPDLHFINMEDGKPDAT